MAETLLGWFARFETAASQIRSELRGRSVLLYEPPQRERTDTSGSHRLRTASGAGEPTLGGGEPVAVVIEKTKDNALRQRVTVGRTRNNDIVLEHTSVSRFHAWLTEAEEGWAVYDAGSRNGTWVRNKRIEPRTVTPLRSGDRVRIGSVELTFLSAAAFVELLSAKKERPRPRSRAATP